MLFVRLWDGLAVLLFFAWAGGVHIDPGARDFVPPKEASLAAVALLAATAGAIRLWANASVEDGFLYRSASWLLERWSLAVERRPARTLTIATAAIALVWTTSSLRRHWALGTNSFDLGIYTNALWNLTHGFGYVSSLKGGMNLFGDHQTPTYWLVAPFFGVWPHPELLLILQAVAYATTGAALYVIGRQYGGRGWWGAAALPLLYWTYLPARNANAFDARPDSFMVPLFCWAIAGLQSRGTIGRATGALAMILAVGCKETAAMIAVAIGVAWALGAGPADTRRFSRRLGIALAPLAGAAFYLDVAVVPGLVGADYGYANLYSQYGPGVTDLALAPLTHTRQFWQQLTQVDVFSYLFWTLAPLAFLPALDWCAWLVSGPAYLALFLVNTPYRINLEYQYSNEISVGLFWGCARVLPMLGAVPARELQVWIAAWALASSAGSDVLRLQHYAPTFYAEWIQQQLAPAIDPGASVSASDALVPHLATRHWITNLADLKGEGGQPVACIVTDLGVNDRWLKEPEVDAIARDALGRGYRLEFACGSVKILSRPNTPCLRHALKCPI